MKIIRIFVVTDKGAEPLFENHDQNDQRLCAERRSRGNGGVFIHNFSLVILSLINREKS